jgi:hypothetical protein
MDKIVDLGGLKRRGWKNMAGRKTTFENKSRRAIGMDGLDVLA